MCQDNANLHRPGWGNADFVWALSLGLVVFYIRDFNLLHLRAEVYLSTGLLVYFLPNQRGFQGGA